MRSDFATRAMRLTYRFGEPFVMPDPKLVDPLVAEFLALPGNEAGGLLHIVLDDSNVEEEHVEFCRDQARAANDEDAYWLAQLLLCLTEEQRWSMDFVCPCCRPSASAPPEPPRPPGVA